MPELRLTLLLVGLIFLVGLAWWELRRPHQARGRDLPRPVPDPLDRPADRTADWDLPPATALSRARGAELELPRMSARDPDHALPVFELDPEQFAAFEASAQSTEIPTREAAVVAAVVMAVPEERTAALEPNDFREDFSNPEPQFLDTRFGEDFAVDVKPEPLLDAAEPTGGSAVVAPRTEHVDGLLEELGAHQSADPPISDIAVDVAEALEPLPEPEPQSHPEPEARVEPPALASPVVEPEAVAAPEPEPLPEMAEQTPSVIVDWPTAEASRVLSVRVVSVGEKFSGRAVRLGLAAEGFVIGKFDIFHKPAADGRALLSIAGLNKPGTFDLRSIDMQRFSGLNLFAVLPGPLPGPAALDELLACAQVLAQRLRGVLQDELGAPMSSLRVSALRDAAATAPT